MWRHAPSYYVFATLAQFHLLGRLPYQLRFRSGSVAWDDEYSASLGRLLSKSRFRFVPRKAATVVRSVVSPTATTLKLFPRGAASTGKMETPHATHRCAYSHAAYIQSAGSSYIAFGLLETLRPHRNSQALNIGEWYHFQLSYPNDTDTKSGLGRWQLVGSASRGAERSCVTPWTQMFRDSSFSLTTISGIPLPRFFTRRHTQHSTRRVKVWKIIPSFSARDRSKLTATLNPTAVDGTTINFSSFSRSIRRPGQDARNKARKKRASQNPENIMGVLWTRTTVWCQP